MRVIGGRLKGRTICPPQGYRARPTTDFAKEGLFNVIDNEYEFEGLKVLDLFSGTGAIGFEFASRGASSVLCVEKERDNAAFIRSESVRLGLAQVAVVRADALDFLSSCTGRYDMVFADPPYALEGLEEIPDRVFSAGLLYPERYLVLEHGAEHSFSAHPFFVKEKAYGRVHFSFFESPSSM